MTLNSYPSSGVTGSATAPVYVMLRIEPRASCIQGKYSTKLATSPDPSYCPREISEAPNFQSPRTTDQRYFIKFLLILRVYAHSNLKSQTDYRPLFAVCGRGPEDSSTLIPHLTFSRQHREPRCRELFRKGSTSFLEGVITLKSGSC